MTHRLTITASDMCQIDRSAIFEIIRRENPISHSAIAKRLVVSLPTVMFIVDELVEEGFVRAEGSTVWSGAADAHCWNSMQGVLLSSVWIWAG